MRRFRLLWIVTAGVQLCSTGRLLGQSVDVVVSPATQTVNVGDPVTVEIRLNTNGLDTCMGGAFLELDSAHLSFVSGMNNTATWNSPLFNVEPAQNHDAMLDISYVSLSVGASSAVNGNDLLVSTLHFTATAPGPAALTLLFNENREETRFFGADCVSSLDTNRIDGSVTIQESGTPCIGDCDGSGTVTVDEILTLVNIALTTLPVSACPQGVGNATAVTIDLIIEAVNNALGSCGGGGGSGLAREYSRAAIPPT
jgi:hypothetical protein